MLLLIPGPVQTRPEVRAAMAVDIAPWDRDFFPEYIAIREKLRDVAGGVAGQHACLPLQGAGHFITEAAIRSFIPPQGQPGAGRLLIPMNGAYAERMARLAREAGRAVVTLPCPDTRGVTPAEIALALAADPAISHVGVVYSETGSGIVNDVPAIGAVVREHGRRMIVDAVSAFGALPFDLKAQPEVDAVVFTSNKCIEGLPGLGFAICPVERVEQAAGQAGSWSFDLADVYATAQRAGWGSFRFTPPVQALHAFGIALDIFLAEGGQPARLARYRENCRILYEGGRALGLKPYLDWKQQGPIIALFHQPEHPGFGLQRFVDALKRRGVLISNFHNTVEPTFRIGCIGHVGPDEIRFALGAMRGALDELGVRRRDAA
ncbi:2-aminoethylphosphonate--pyruvate transaminase [Teichococcus vastitatis]|uniref:2-aminoethylphosphonate--pyruvate transaminase n=1 Tax=Teichococcus vastitatis TaxID=2307076 RepID=A0ABS9WBD1_9PROT|nr:2-aminoethylphosphonate--pyruvate transaminase [Pseudoroseomonas vastitatis]MCI0756603.1 2-aminoethylphosphonate--pyruvate transaminase [Pseudoroseomonas vastitatis]